MAAWWRFLAPYYVVNALLVLLYAALRLALPTTSPLFLESNNNLTREQYIFVIVGVLLVLKSRKTRTWDGLALNALLYLRAAVLGALASHDLWLGAGYAAVLLASFLLLSLPTYAGPTRVTPLRTAAALDEAVAATKRCVVMFTAAWSPVCSEAGPLVADLSLAYPHLPFYAVDTAAVGEAVVQKHRINPSGSSAQIPTLVVFERGAEARRVPAVETTGRVTPWTISRASIAQGLGLDAPLAEPKHATAARRRR